MFTFVPNYKDAAGFQCFPHQRARNVILSLLLSETVCCRLFVFGDLGNLGSLM